MAGMKILIADDDVVVHESLGIYLKEGKFYDLQTNEIHELVGFERVKNAIKENDFVFDDGDTSVECYEEEYAAQSHYCVTLYERNLV